MRIVITLLYNKYIYIFIYIRIYIYMYVYSFILYMCT
jgi:hypothetical protein